MNGIPPLLSWLILVWSALGAIGLAVVGGLVHGWLSERRVVRRVNRRVAELYDEPYGGSVSWSPRDEVRR